MDGSSGKILTMDNLKNRHICIVEWCCMCKVSGNLQIICLFIVIMHRVYGLWCFVCSVSLGLCLNTLWICWLVGWGGLGDLIRWLCGGLFLYVLIWIIWKERNQRTLEGIEHSPMELKLFLLRSLYDWMAASSSHSFFI
jgi:hypothetical protein